MNSQTARETTPEDAAGKWRAKRRAEENSVIDHGYQARTTELYTTPDVKAKVNLKDGLDIYIKYKMVKDAKNMV